jgi:DNA-binding CsgD family transcriptional regulator
MRQLELHDSRIQRWLVLLLVCIALGGITDLILDRPSTVWSFHVLFEVAFLLLCLGGAAFLWSAGYRAARSHERTRRALQERQEELEEWRGRAQRLLQGLGVEIDRQLRSWQLTSAEREVALLLLKGFSTKQIAALLERSDRTVRQHCSAVYKKSGLAGRAELGAFFLEDLLLPVGEQAAGEAAAPVAKRSPQPSSAP